MNFDHPNRKLLITGKSGTGKTTEWIRRLKTWPAKWVFVFDPERQFARKTGVKVAMTTEGLNYSLASQKFVVFDPTAMFPGDREQAFAFFCRWVLTQSRILKGVKVFAADELQGVQDVGLNGVPKSFRELSDEGRRQEIDLVLVAQAVADVNHKIRRQINKVISFQHTDPAALEILRRMGLPTEQVATLPKYSFIEADLDYATHRRIDPTGKGSRRDDRSRGETRDGSGSLGNRSANG